MTVDLQLISSTDQAGRPLFKLLSAYRYHLGPGCTITVPAGYVTNFGTIPRWFYFVVSPTQLKEAAIVHDWMCNETFHDGETPSNSGYSRWLADAVLYEGMARLGFGFFRRFVVFAAVRIYAIATGQTNWVEPPQPMTINDGAIK